MGLEGIVASYLAERRAVGVRPERYEGRPSGILELHGRMGCPEDALPRELVEAWCEPRPGESEANRLERTCRARGLAEYMVRSGFDAYVAPRGHGWRERGSYEPHIFTDAELAAPFSAAERLAGDDPCSARSQAALVMRLLHSTGMRCGEACGLAKGDVDLDARMLTVRHAKNDRDRLVPLHPAVAERLRGVSGALAAAQPKYASHDRPWSPPGGRPLTTQCVYLHFRRALWEAGISHGGRGKGPRVHDLRFTFACHRLRAWAREGADVNAPMPVLAAYMGHADTRCTEYYLRLTAELYPGMVEQVERGCGWVVPSRAGGKRASRGT